MFLWTGSRDTKAGLAQLKRRPDTDLLHAGQIGARPAEPPGVSYMARASPGRWLCHGPRRARRRRIGHPQALSWASDTLESESKELLDAWGVGSAREHRANSAESRRRRRGAARIPVALKVHSPDNLHKTRLGSFGEPRDMAQVRTASPRSWPAPRPMRQARIIGVSVQEMVGEGVEVIAGVSCDRNWARCCCSAGRRDGRVYNDVALRRCPITRSEAQAMIAEVKGARLLQGFRGRPAADLRRSRIPGARVAPRHAPRRTLAALDINPLMVLPSGQGVKAVDALVVFRGT